MNTTMQTTTIRNTYLVLIACLMVLSGTMQAKAVDYSPCRASGLHQTSATYQSATPAGSDMASMPYAGFQSTSAYSGQWAETANSLNANGSINEAAYLSTSTLSGPRRVPGTPGGGLSDDTQQPLGDAVLPLMLLACAYAIYRLSRKRAREI